MSSAVDYLLIGGGVAGASAAASLRSEGATGRIVMISADKMLPYYRPVLSKIFNFDEITQKKTEIHSPQYYQENNIDIVLDTKVIAVDPQNNLVRTDKSGNFTFKKLLIATGSHSQPDNIPGADLAGIHFLYNFSDSKAISNELAAGRKAVILGGNSMSIELASSFIEAGLHVTIVADDFILFNVYDFDDPKNYLKKNGVEIVCEKSIRKFNGTEKIESIETVAGKIIACDFVVIVANNQPTTNFLKDSGIEVDDGIVVDKYMQTNFEDIYAVGDAARFFDPLYGRYRRVEGTDNANKQSKIAVLNMLGGRTSYRSTSYCFFSAFDNSFVIVGDNLDVTEKIMRGSIIDKSFAILYLQNDYLKAALFCGRPVTEIKAVESLIVNRINLSSYKNKLTDTTFAIEPLAAQNVLTLQGGGALGAFEAGVVSAMEELAIYPDIVAGISIGAFNAAIIAANPKNASAALSSFWDELVVDTFSMPDEQTRRMLSSWQSIVWGSPKFFQPRWLMPTDNCVNLPYNWTSFYDPSAVKTLLSKYVDFSKLKNSPVRLLVMAVNVETSEFETFDSYTDEITADHILASGSLPPGFPWTTIDGKHYWDGGIVSNTPLDAMLEICGYSGKKIYIVELYPRNRDLPQNMFDVITRKDEIHYSEKIRTRLRERETNSKFRKIVEIILKLSTPEVIEQVEQLPIYIQTIGDPGILCTTRIIREVNKDDPYSWDSDFSKATIEEHKKKGYDTAKKALS